MTDARAVSVNPDPDIQLEEWRYPGESFLLDRDAKMVYQPEGVRPAPPVNSQGRFQAGDLVPWSPALTAPALAVSSAAPERDPNLRAQLDGGHVATDPFAGSATPLFASPRLDMDALPPPSAAFAPLAPLPPVAQHEADARRMYPTAPRSRRTQTLPRRYDRRRPRARALIPDARARVPRASAPLDASSAPPPSTSPMLRDLRAPTPAARPTSSIDLRTWCTTPSRTPRSGRASPE